VPGNAVKLGTVKSHDGLFRFPYTAVLGVFACVLLIGGCTAGNEPPQDSAAPATPPPVDGLAGVRVQTQALITTLRSAAGTSVDLDAKSRQLVETALPVAGAFAHQHAECAEYITLALDGAALMDALSAEQLERSWYHDGSVPPAPAHCQHAQDLVVRPVRMVAQMRERALSETRAELLTSLDALLEDVAALERL